MSGYKEMHGMPPPYSSGPPAGAGYGYPGYAPAPPVFPQQQQSNNTNVVVVGQPSAPSPPPVTVVRQPRSNDFMVCTVVLFILCLIHGNILAVLLLIPALICSITASNHNNAGQYDSAKQCGELALCCNILVVLKYIVLVVVIVVVVVLFLTGVLVFTSSAAADSNICHQVCTTDIYGFVQCREVCF